MRKVCAIAALALWAGPAFASETTVCWQAPTKNVDGSTLTDLAGFRVYQRNGILLIETDAQASCATFGIPDERTFLYATAFTESGDESLPSNEVCREATGDNCDGWTPAPIIQPGNASVILDWSYEVAPPMTAWNLDDAAYSTKHFATGSYESAAYGNAWGDSGNKWYIVGTSGDSVDEFDASTPYDVSTLSYVQTFALRVGVNQERNPQGIHWQPDGMAFFGVTSYQDKVFKYTVSSAWDSSTAAYSQTFSVSGQTTDPRSMALSSDGTKFWIMSGAGVIYAYTMSTGFDLSGAAYASVSKTLSAGTESAWVSMWSDGDELFAAGTTDDTVYHWSLSTTWDLSTAGSVLSDTYDFSAESVALASLSFKPDGSAFYIVSDDLATDEVFQYDITVGGTTHESALAEGSEHGITVSTTNDAAAVLSFGLQHGFTTSALANLNASLTIGQSNEAAFAGGNNTQAAVEFGVETAFSPLAGAVMEASYSQGMTLGEALLAGLVIQAIYEQAAAFGLTLDSIFSIEAQLSEGTSHALQISATNELGAEFIASLSAGLQLGSNYIAETALEEGTVFDAVSSVIADLNVQLQQGIAAGSTFVGSGVTNAGVSFSVTATVTSTGTTFDATIVTPDRRIYTVTLESRTFTPDEGPRIFKPTTIGRTHEV